MPPNRDFQADEACLWIALYIYFSAIYGGFPAGEMQKCQHHCGGATGVDNQPLCLRSAFDDIGLGCGW